MSALLVYIVIVVGGVGLYIYKQTFYVMAHLEACVIPGHKLFW